MTLPDPDSASKSHVLKRFGRGLLPIVIVIFLLWGVSMGKTADPMTVAVAFALSAIILWFGWSGIRNNLLTKWMGIFVALFVGAVLSLFIFGIVLQLSLLLLVLLLVALPLLMYDLVFRSPFKGRFARARSERRHLGSRP